MQFADVLKCSALGLDTRNMEEQDDSLFGQIAVTVQGHSHFLYLCDDAYFSHEETRVICKELGYTHGIQDYSVYCEYSYG